MALSNNFVVDDDDEEANGKIVICKIKAKSDKKCYYESKDQSSNDSFERVESLTLIEKSSWGWSTLD